MRPEGDNCVGPAVRKPSSDERGAARWTIRRCADLVAGGTEQAHQSVGEVGEVGLGSIRDSHRGAAIREAHISESQFGHPICADEEAVGAEATVVGPQRVKFLERFEDLTENGLAVPPSPRGRGLCGEWHALRRIGRHIDGAVLSPDGAETEMARVF